MPVYDYQCGKCSEMFEREHPMAFSGKVRCPACGSRSTMKVFHAAGVHFKGSGFYVTDSSKSRAAANGEVKDTKPAANADSTKPSSNGKVCDANASGETAPKSSDKTTAQAK